MASQGEAAKLQLPSDAQLRHMVREAVGEVMAEQEKRRVQRPKPRRPRGILLGLVVGAAAAALLAFAPGNLGARGTIPAELLGTWTPSAPTHGNRGFTFNAHTVTFYTGTSDSSTLPIRSVQSQPDMQGTQYMLEYSLLGERYEFAFSYHPAHGGVISFGNHPELTWRRGGPPARGTAPGAR